MILNIRNYFQTIRTLETEFLILENGCKILNNEPDFIYNISQN